MRAPHPTTITNTHPPQLAYAQYMAARQHAHAQLSSQAHAFPFTLLNVHHAGPYTPTSPQHSAHPIRTRKSPPPPVRTRASSQHHLPLTPMSPWEQQHPPSPGTPREASLRLHHGPPYPPPYPQASPQTPRYPPTTSSQQPYEPTAPIPTPRHHSSAPPPRESAEVMLRKLELEEAEAKLRASITQERLRAEVVAKKQALARALMLEEKRLR
ncbi:hypothetical protein P171DRAFT_167159 [Karstenula rhodostoma CBS 690.94]|uniref:Uncharacterized protein n=1 Tax=Karstenula rhodostoma CBS 690.94 TaxID=1392251 RepID=A0A9P4P678_9PLEO|nr:hypothetical protein P171DRAFT_167159 [Karstenula rhodostoma CBS 690.94]